MANVRLKVAVAGAAQAGVSSVTITEQNHRHVIAVIDVQYRHTDVSSSNGRPARLLWPEGAALQIDHGFLTNSGTFYGYVVGHQVLEEDDQSRKQYMTVRYLAQGTSYPMQTARSRSWSDATASYLATTLAHEYGLVPVVDKHPWNLGYRAQSGISDFRFLTERACEVGFDFSVSGPYLRFQNPVVALDSVAVSNLPRFTMDRTPKIPDTLINFAPVVGELLSAGGVQARRVSDVLAASGTVLTAIAGDGMTIKARGLTQSYAEAEQVVKAERLANTKWVAATARTLGDPRLHVGTVINVSGAAMVDAHKGLWSVDTVCHEYDINPSAANNSTYFCSLDVRRDKQRLVRDIPSMKHNPVQSPVTMSLFNGRWRANGR